MIRAAIIACLLATPADAQDVASTASAILRGLDKVNGNVRDIEIAAGTPVNFGRIAVSLSECRYPSGNPAGNAYALLEIKETGENAPIFNGWMIASSPALSALDHPRYDVWVLRCITS